MADKKISDLTAATSVADADLLLIETSGGNSRKVTRANFRQKFRGALVKKAANQTGADYSTAAAISWDNEAYDTDTIHDNSTNPSRLTVPSGVSYVRLSYAVLLSSVAADSNVQTILRKNNSDTFTGVPYQIADTDSTGPRLSAISAPLAVSPGDYFEVFLGITTGDTSIDVNATYSWFAMEILE